MSLPAKILLADISMFEPVSTWDIDDGKGDPWIGAPYRWRCLLTVQPQIHSSHLTRTPYQYDALDVKVGDVLTTMSGGRYLKVVTIEDRTEDFGASFHVIVEDENRENTFQANDGVGQGSGLLSEGEGIIFEVKDGLPVIFPLPNLPTSLREAFVSEVITRFFHSSAIFETGFDQTAHGFIVGDAVGLNASGFFKAQANSEATSFVVGYVTDVPHVNHFRVRPVAQIMNIAVTGNPGDKIYLSVDVAGGLTNIVPASGSVVPLFIKIDDSRVLLFSNSGSGGSAVTSADITVVGADVGSFKTGDVVTAGTTLEDIISKILKTRIAPTYSSPTISLSGSGAKTIEVGTEIIPTLTPVWTQNDAGLVSGYSLKKNGTEVLSNSSPVEFTEVSFNAPEGVTSYVASVTFADGVVKNDNLGNPSSEGQIVAGTISSTAVAYSGARRCFYGSTSEHATSANIRALSESALGSVDGLSRTSEEFSNATSFVIAYPATLRDLTSVVFTSGGFPFNVTSEFVKASNVVVEGANSYTGVEYKVFVYQPVASFSGSVTFTI